MSLPRLMAIVDADAARGAGWPMIDLASAFLRGGATLLQLRAKAAPGRWLFDAASAIVALAHEANAHVIVNDRADIATIERCGRRARRTGRPRARPGSSRRERAGRWSVSRPIHRNRWMPRSAQPGELHRDRAGVRHADEAIRRQSDRSRRRAGSCQSHACGRPAARGDWRHRAARAHRMSSAPAQTASP